PGLIGVFETRCRGDDAIAQLRAMAIAGSVDRLQHLGREPRGFLQDTFDVIDREVRINAVVDSALEFADVAHHEQHLVDGRAIGHGVTSTSPSALASTAPGRGVAWRAACTL